MCPQTTSPAAPSYGGSGANSMARDVGTFGMAANRVRALNNTLASVIERLNREGARLRSEPTALTGKESAPTPPPSASIPGLMSELDQAEILLANLVNAAGFIESL